MTEVGWTACSHLPKMPNQRSRGQAFLVTKRLWYSAVIFRRLCKMTVQHRISLRSCTWFKSYFHIRKGQRAASFFILSNLALMSSSICKRSILHPESFNWRSCQASQEESWCCLQTTVYQLSSWQMQLKTCQSKTVLNALCSVLEAAVPEFSGANCSRGLVQQTHSHWIHWRRWVNESAWKGSIETRALYIEKGWSRWFLIYSIIKYHCVTQTWQHVQSEKTRTFSIVFCPNADGLDLI